MLIVVFYSLQGANTKVTIDDLCDIMTNQSIGDELHRYAAVNSMFLKMEGSNSLDVSYEGYVEFMKGTDWNSPAAEGGKNMYIK